MGPLSNKLRPFSWVMSWWNLKSIKFSNLKISLTFRLRLIFFSCEVNLYFWKLTLFFKVKQQSRTLILNPAPRVWKGENSYVYQTILGYIQEEGVCIGNFLVWCIKTEIRGTWTFKKWCFHCTLGYSKKTLFLNLTMALSLNIHMGNMNAIKKKLGILMHFLQSAARFCDFSSQFRLF